MDTSSIIKELPTFSQRGITELSIHDRKLSSDKNALIKLCKAIQSDCPGLFLSLTVDPSAIDRTLIGELQNIYCSLEISLHGCEKGDALLFDKKFFSSKADLLNRGDLVFGFDLEYGLKNGDTFKAFKDRLDFATTLYPNHIDFSQLEDKNLHARPTGIYSSKDLELSQSIAFACKTFYSAGRAVPWFNSVIKALKISPSAFFADFAEWQMCNNCSLKSGFSPDDVRELEIEKMQLMFIQEKLEEKHKQMLFDAISDIIRINGAFSRVAAENEESIIETSYNPDDLLSPFALDIHRFCDGATMEPCKVKIFAAEDAPDYKIL